MYIVCSVLLFYQTFLKVLWSVVFEMQCNIRNVCKLSFTVLPDFLTRLFFFFLRFYWLHADGNSINSTWKVAVSCFTTQHQTCSVPLYGVGVADPLEIRPSPRVTLLNLVRLGQTKEIRLRNLTHLVPPFRVYQGHRKRHAVWHNKE